MSTDERREGLDLFQGDMAAHQQLTGREVTAEANRELAAAEFAKLDAAGRFDRSEEVGHTPAVPVQAFEETRAVGGKEYRVTRDAAANGPMVKYNKLEHEFGLKALERLKMLLELPESGILGTASWRQRAMAVSLLLVEGSGRAAAELAQLLEDSDKVFGSFLKDPERKLYLT